MRGQPLDGGSIQSAAKTPILARGRALDGGSMWKSTKFSTNTWDLAPVTSGQGSHSMRFAAWCVSPLVPHELGF